MLSLRSLSRQNCCRLIAACTLLVGVMLCSASLAADVKQRPVSYSRDIKPIFSNRCYACHGPDQKQVKADLRLDVRAVALESAIVEGNAAESPLIERVSSSDADEMMPPPDSKKPRLTAAQVDLLRRWIDEGAKFDDHWAYVKPVRPPAPQVANAAWARNPIDTFIAAQHESHGLQPSQEADKRTLIRRLSFDLTGLPPTPHEIDAFVADNSPQAYEKLVDRLLTSKHYGERMAMYWLDLVRFADTGGYHSDNHRDLAPYRDYVIAAFNENKPFDRFTVEQLAGDLLPDATTETKIASGYNRLLMTTEEGGAQAKEYTAKYSADRVRNASEAWLGATMGCAECHDHKFDPFKTRDFYGFAAFFADIQEKGVGRQDQVKLPTKEQEARLAKIDEQLASLRKTMPETDDAKSQIAKLEQEKKSLQDAFSSTLISVSVTPRAIRILPRGNWLDDSGEVVQPDVPWFLSRLDVKDRRANRLDLANWLVSSDNPLVARVFVNRLWKLAFGHGLVRTAVDFGTQGELPSHPELLDWLAVEFRESGWNVKHVLKLMVMSSTYRQTSLASNELQERDPTNDWFARQDRYRLDAELVRDNALAVSGLLTRKIGGPSVKPYQPEGYWDYLNFPKRTYQNDHGEDLYRRGMYTYWQRTFVNPSLVAFDAPSREECTVQRPRSNTPLQALVLLNDPTYVEAARVFAVRIVREGGTSNAERITFAYRQALGRQPGDAELKILRQLYENHLQQYNDDKAAAARVLKVGESAAPSDMEAAELAAWTSIARVILNLHEIITRS
jgi:hypothetical protein